METYLQQLRDAIPAEVLPLPPPPSLSPSLTLTLTLTAVPSRRRWGAQRPSRRGSMVRVPALVGPQLGSCASSGRAWRLTARHSQGEARPLGAQPLPRVLELAASRAAESTAFEHAGAAGRRAPGAAGPQARQDHEGGARGGPATAGGGLTRLDLYRSRQLLIAYRTHQLQTYCGVWDLLWYCVWARGPPRSRVRCNIYIYI